MAIYCQNPTRTQIIDNLEKKSPPIIAVTSTETGKEIEIIRNKKHPWPDNNILSTNGELLIQFKNIFGQNQDTIITVDHNTEYINLCVDGFLDNNEYTYLT
ncbi:MAG: hypothetical protein AAF731_17580 [Bacteroidota bacterium]